MTTVARFPPALGEWVVQQLDQGWPAAALIDTLNERGIPPQASRAIVEGFVRARLLGLPVPQDSVPLAEPARLRPGHVIEAGGRRIRVAARAERPVAAVLGGVLDADECAELIEMARPRLQPSTIVDPGSGRDVVTGLRSSLGMFFLPCENPLIERIDRRLAELMNMPLSHGEGLQILHYPVGAGSAPHHDYLAPTNAANQASVERSGQRVSTLVTYLNDVEAGGETLFPALGWAVSPQRGNAIYFEYSTDAGECDPASLHASNAVEAGEKWVATKWVRARPFKSLSPSAAGHSKPSRLHRPAGSRR